MSERGKECPQVLPRCSPLCGVFSSVFTFCPLAVENEGKEKQEANEETKNIRIYYVYRGVSWLTMAPRLSFSVQCNMAARPRAHSDSIVCFYIDHLSLSHCLPPPPPPLLNVGHDNSFISVRMLLYAVLKKILAKASRT